MLMKESISRQSFLRKALAGTVLAPGLLQACANGSDVKPDGTTTTSGSTTTPGSTTGTNIGTCSVTDTETDGPYPLYNSRGSAITRIDVSDGKTGVPLSMDITVKNVNNNCWDCGAPVVPSGTEAMDAF